MSIRNTDDSFNGVVLKKNTGTFIVRSTDEKIVCSLSARILKQIDDSKRGSRAPRSKQVFDSDEGRPDQIVVGDQVEFVRSANSSTGTITAILPRKNKLARRSAVPMPGAHAHEQVIIANVDQVVPVFAAANPAPHWNMLDRYLVSAESAGIPAMIVITKSDLLGAPMNGDDLEGIISEYRRIGYRVQMVSAHTREGLDALHQELGGRSSVFLGKSGVGKTSLLNALQPGLGLRVNAVNQVTGKGKHTTTSLEMFELDARGTTIVDTPGVREFGLWDVEEDDLALYFPEMRPLAVSCKFGRGCRHDEEPGCAVRKGVMNGLISPRRYHSYVRLLEDA